MRNNKRRRKYLGTAFQKKMLLLVFLSAVIPAVIVATCMYYLIFNAMAKQLFIPEQIAYNLMPVLQQVNLALIISLPFVLLLIWWVALELSHRIAGPVYRIEKELDELLSGKKVAPIKLRKKDELKNLVEKINRLAEKIRL
ncbi:MAG: hypothetical protein Q8N85_03175 [Candidatus Omnitrophota bacterium]|nr:hypothetical protein [Candidatus Omnitrophota bacterium]